MEKWCAVGKGLQRVGGELAPQPRDVGAGLAAWVRLFGVRRRPLETCLVRGSPCCHCRPSDVTRDSSPHTDHQPIRWGLPRKWLRGRESQGPDPTRGGGGQGTGTQPQRLCHPPPRVRSAGRQGPRLPPSPTGLAAGTPWATRGSPLSSPCSSRLCHSRKRSVAPRPACSPTRPLLPAPLPHGVPRSAPVAEWGGGWWERPAAHPRGPGVPEAGGRPPAVPTQAPVPAPGTELGGHSRAQGSSGLGNAEEDPAATLPARPRPLARAAPRALLPVSPRGTGAEGPRDDRSVSRKESAHPGSGARSPLVRRPAHQTPSRPWTPDPSMTAAQPRGPVAKGHTSKVRTRTPAPGAGSPAIRPSRCP